MRFVTIPLPLAGRKTAQWHSHKPSTKTSHKMHENMNQLQWLWSQWSFHKRLHQPSHQVCFCAPNPRGKKIPQRQRPTHVWLKKIPCRFELQIFPLLAKEIRAGREKKGVCHEAVHQTSRLICLSFSRFQKKDLGNIQCFRTLKTDGILTLHVPSLNTILRLETWNANGNKPNADHSSTTWPF